MNRALVKQQLGTKRFPEAQTSIWQEQLVGDPRPHALREEGQEVSRQAGLLDSPETIF